MRISQANYLTNKHDINEGGGMSKFRIIVICILMITVTACGSPEQKRAKHMERGLKYFNDGKYNEAIIEYKNAVQISPKDSEGHYRLGLALIKSGRKQE